MFVSGLNSSDQAIAESLKQVTQQADLIESVLTTNDRVIARVTDGIYRQPGSAIRELIANAYDADASWVTVKTDAPKFSRVSIEDNGTGMSPETVVHLLRNIGGSAKRTEQGQELGIASSGDPTESPGGRKLIGKLGIGIFSVSQLTHSFQIVTKTAGDRFRTVVLVNLRQFADEPTDGDETEFQAGSYQAWREPTDDLRASGTTIVLTAIRPQTRDTLRSEQLWSAIDNPITEQAETKSASSVPTFHIGRLNEHDLHVKDGKKDVQNLPWDRTDTPEDSFGKMVDCVWRAVQGRTTVKLADLFDTYLQMVWNLSLALPLPYEDQGLLDESTDGDWAYIYKLSNSSRGSASRLTPSGADEETIRELADLPPADKISIDKPFNVYIDGVSLKRPLRFRQLPTTRHILKKPMVFVGSVREDFSGFAREVSAGPLEFDGYLFWTPKIAPTEHQGVLVRIHGASGTLFDSTFLGYQVAELTRLRQITCEIFVTQGLEAALNIDRESFNTAHPHTVLLTKWVHSALRQLATAQKREAQLLRAETRSTTRQQSTDRVTRIIEAANDLRTDGEGVVPVIRFSAGSSSSSSQPDVQTLDLRDVLAELPEEPAKAPSSENVRRLEAITAVLTVYGVFDHLSPKERDNLLGSVLGILEAENLG